MGAVKRKRLPAIGGVIGVVEIKGDADWGAAVAGNELLRQGASYAVDVAAA